MTSPRWPYYLPVNPYCGTNTCGCTDPCGNPCADSTRQTDSMIYNGPNLPWLGIDTNDTLTTVIEKVEEKFSELADFVGYTTTTTTTIA